jgi:hypothetical protein
MSNLFAPVTRFFSGDKVLPGKVVNALGGQVWRSLLARGLYRTRSVNIAADLQERFETLNNEGLLLWSDFLPAEEFQQVREEAARLREDTAAKHTTLHHGPNDLNLVTYGAEEVERYPAITRFYQDRRFVELMSAAERRSLGQADGTRHYENLVQGPGDEHDPETDLHSDIFFHTHKAWFYLEDVGLENGPLVVVPRSQRMTLLHLRDTYRESIGNNKGSRRVSAEQLRRYGLAEKEVIVPANTLVIANVHGFHCRRRGVPGNQRHALHWTMRSHPFFKR